MATATEVTQEVQERFLDTVQVGQKAVVDFVRSWADTVEATFSKLPEFTLSDSGPRPGQAFEAAFGFTERLLASQRDFANLLFEAVVPATRAPSAAARQAAQSAQSAQSAQGTQPGKAPR
ncbi:MAG: hypothetical protein ACRD2W_09670 [Acidimicrobiales bacterium]